LNATAEKEISSGSVSLTDFRVLVLAPIAKDAELTLQLLHSAGFEGESCRGLFDVRHKIDLGCGALVLAEEALATSSLSVLVDWLANQPSWSDLPIIVVTTRGEETAESRRILKTFGASAHLALIERPFRRSTLLSALDFALRSRKRQYAVRDLLNEQTRIARSLAESEEGLRLALDSTRLGTWDHDPLSGVLKWSPRCRELFGLANEDDVTYELFLSVVHPEDRERVHSQLQSILKRGENFTFDAEYRVIGLRDGVARWIRATGQAYSSDLDGDPQVVRVIGTVQDVTRRKEIEQSLRQQNERLELLSDALSHLLQSQRPEEIVRTLFQRVAEHLGVDAYFNFLVDEEQRKLRLQSATGLPPETLESIRELDYGQAICGRVAQQREPIVVTHIQDSRDPRADLVRKFGIRAYACHPLVSGERLIGTLSFASRARDSFRDDELQFIQLISQYVSVALDRARAEEALRSANESLEREVQARTAKLQETIGELEAFSYSITHDMRAPLRAMQGFAIALQEESSALAPDCQDYVRRIVSSANRMDQLITDVLNYSRTLRADVELRVLDFGTVTRGILETYPQFQNPEVRIELEEPFPRVYANEAALTQCISNLLNNAVKFVARGTSPHVRIRAERRDRKIRFCFEDNGIGIRPEYQSKIWGLFQKLNRGYEGTGLGLAIVRKAVERMGGSVGVESEPGKGSRFWLDLRAAEQ